MRERIGAGAYPLGIKPDLTWPVEPERSSPANSLFLHSDGLSEARNVPGATSSATRGSKAAFDRVRGLSPQDLAGRPGSGGAIPSAAHEARTTTSRSPSCGAHV